MKSTFPLILTDAHIVSTTLVNEDSTDAWNIATAYDVGDYVHLVATHMVYRCTQANTGNDPTNDDGTYWVRYGRTNYWNCLANDTATATEAEGASGFQYVIEVDKDCDTVALLGLRSASVNVTVKNLSAVEVFNETQTATVTVGTTVWYKPVCVFKDIGATNGFTVEVTVNDTGVSGSPAQCAKICIGRTFDIAETVEDSTTISFVDYSKKQQAVDGKWTVVQRGFSKQVNFSLSHLTTRNRWVLDVLTWKNTTPCVWWVDNEAELDKGVVAYGYIMEPSLSYGVGKSQTDVEVLGLSFNPPEALSTVAPAVTPEPFALADWDLDSGGSDSLDVTINNLPLGTTDIEYSITLTGGGGGPSWTPFTSTGGTTSFSITGCDPDTEYSVRLQAVGPGGDSGTSDTKSATTDAAPVYTFSGYVAGLTASLSAAQSIPDEAYTTVSWTEELYDDAWTWTAGATSFTVPAGVGVVVVNVMLATNPFDDDRGRAVVRKNGTIVANESSSKMATMSSRVYAVIAVSPGDTISVQSYFETGPADLGDWDDRTFVTIEGY